ncbi:DUF6477 family protein [Yoonia sp.]|jgi:hypothetical protein|uniref:DUF6477 family protein n=1 Tax=Yoonia sp. TaxID=2212373 RepID=UPI0025D20556|nr:DUF6477 family protein [Yoonia sp.]
MLDLKTRIATLQRPSLLARAARFGVDDYRRATHLRRILQIDPLPRHADALMRLLDLEGETNTLRQQKSGSYSPARHVELLIAIAGEARLLRETGPRLT